MLGYTIDTLKHSPVASRIVLAIPEGTENDPLVAVATEYGINCFRGSESNVLERFYNASLMFKDDYYFRATGDNPIIDAQNLQRSLDHLIKENLDYVMESGLPLGAVVEAFTAEALERSFREGSSPEDLEHVTWYMKKSGRFHIHIIQGPPELRFPQLRLTVDYPEDFKRVSYIIEHLYKDGIPPFEEVINFVKTRKGSGLLPD